MLDRSKIDFEIKENSNWRSKYTQSNSAYAFAIPSNFIIHGPSRSGKTTCLEQILTNEKLAIFDFVIYVSKHEGSIHRVLEEKYPNSFLPLFTNNMEEDIQNAIELLQKQTFDAETQIMENLKSNINSSLLKLIDILCEEEEVSIAVVFDDVIVDYKNSDDKDMVKIVEKLFAHYLKKGVSTFLVSQNFTKSVPSQSRTNYNYFITFNVPKKSSDSQAINKYILSSSYGFSEKVNKLIDEVSQNQYVFAVFDRENLTGLRIKEEEGVEENCRCRLKFDNFIN
mgnify:CR=1 FL=1